MELEKRLEYRATAMVREETACSTPKTRDRDMKGAMKFILPLLLLAALAGCTSQGKISETVSKFDGTREVTMRRINLKHIELGAYWNTKMKKEEILLVIGRRRSPIIKAGESLHFRIDGEFVNLVAVDEAAAIRFHYRPFAFGGGTRNERRYLASFKLIQRLIASKEIVARLDLAGGDSVESQMESNRVDLREQLKKFIATVEKQR